MGGSGLSSRAIIGRLYELLQTAQAVSWVGPTSHEFSTDQKSEEYKWLGMVPKMREWIGGRHAVGFRENGITIENRHFEATIEFDVDDMRRDKTGQIDIRLGELADTYVDHWADLLAVLINNGETGLCYDGQYFYDTDHSEGDSGTLKNLISAADSSKFNVAVAEEPTPTELADCVMRGIQQFLTFKDDRGRGMNDGARSFFCLFPVNMFASAGTVFTKEFLVNGVSNPVYKSGLNIQWEASSRYTSTTSFDIFRTDARTKALIRQNEKGTLPTVKAQAEDSALEFNESKHQFGIDTWCNVAYGFWQRAVRCKLS